MYDLVMESNESDILPDRLQKAIELRRTTPARLMRDSGVDKSTISLILSGSRPNTAAVIVAKLARSLSVSVDYLMGITNDPEPKALGLGEMLFELTQVAKKLTNRRQRDLLLAAKAYLEDAEVARFDPDRLADDMLDLIKEAGSSANYNQLVDFLKKQSDDEDEDNERDDSPGLLPDNL